MRFRPTLTALVVGLYVLAVLMLLPTRLGVPHAQTFGDDAGQYSALATHLAEDGMYSLDGERPFFEREPGYGTYLAAVYAAFGTGHRGAIFLTQAALLLAAALFLRPEIERVASRRASALFLALVLLHPAVLHAVFSPLREAVALSLAMLCAGATWRAMRTGSTAWAAGAGAFLGALILTYASFMLVPFGFLVFTPLLQMRWKHALCIAGVSILVVSLWAGRNWMHRGEPCVTGCYRAAIQWHVRGEQAETLHGLEPLQCLYAEYVSRNWNGLDPNCSFNAVFHRKWPDGFVGVPADREIARAGRAKALANLPSYLWFSVVEILELHLPYVNGWGFAYNVLAALMTVVLYLGIAGWILSPRWRYELLLPLLLIGYTVGVFILTDATPRYLLPTLFAYAFFGGMGYDWLLLRLRRAAPGAAAASS